MIGWEGGGIPRRDALRAILAGPLAGFKGEAADRRPGGLFSVRDFGAVGDGRAPDAGPIQAAMDAASAEGAGVVWLPPGRYRLGGESLLLRTGVTLKGAGVAGAHEPVGGAQLLYSGTRAAIHAPNVKHCAVEDLLIDFRAAPRGAIGIHLNGAWLSTLRNLRILSAPYHDRSPGVLLDTNGGTWGAQHVYFERLEVPSSTVRLAGTGPNDQVTTTVLNVIRGLRYEIDWASSITMTDTTAEMFPDVGISVRRSDQLTLLGVDIEGPGEVGIDLGEVRSFVALGLSFIGFTGGQRIRGRARSGMVISNMDPVTFWGSVAALEQGGAQ